MQKIIEIDWCNDTYDGTTSTGEAALAHLNNVAQKYNFTYKVVQQESLGGGWPTVHITGDESNLRKFIKEQYDGPGVDMEFYLVD